MNMLPNKGKAFEAADIMQGKQLLCPPVLLYP